MKSKSEPNDGAIFGKRVMVAVVPKFYVNVQDEAIADNDVAVLTKHIVIYTRLGTAEVNSDESKTVGKGHGGKKGNILPLWGNKQTMNLNTTLLANIQLSRYFNVYLHKLSTYHEIIDKIYYDVSHLEPWEKNTRQNPRRFRRNGCIRGVGARGIVSTTYCLLYKLFTLKLTRRQVHGLITHPDSPYIRALGFMYIRYTQPPQDLWDWYDAYLDDPEELDVKAGGGLVMTIGEIVKSFLFGHEWFSTVFPQIPVPVQKKLKMMKERFPARASSAGRQTPDEEAHYSQAEKASRMCRRGYSREREGRRGGSQLDDRKRYSRERDYDQDGRDRGYDRDRRDRDYDRERRDRDYDWDRRDSERDRDYGRDMRDRERDRDYDRDRRDRTRSDRHRHRD